MVHLARRPARVTCCAAAALLLALVLSSQSPLAASAKRGRKGRAFRDAALDRTFEQHGGVEGDIVIFRNGNVTNEAPFVLRASNFEMWERLTAQGPLYDALCNKVPERAQAAAAKVVFAYLPTMERWIYPGIEVGHRRKIQLPTNAFNDGGRKTPGVGDANAKLCPFALRRSLCQSRSPSARFLRS
eukprot:SAG11_NODE_2320_length_3524_cov_71.912993_3_plen_186_part_00